MPKINGRNLAISLKEDLLGFMIEHFSYDSPFPASIFYFVFNSNLMFLVLKAGFKSGPSGVGSERSAIFLIYQCMKLS